MILKYFLLFRYKDSDETHDAVVAAKTGPTGDGYYVLNNDKAVRYNINSTICNMLPQVEE
jgi:hypothetical protein